MSNNILDQLDQLTDEEMKKVGNLINKFAKRHSSENQVDNRKPREQNKPQRGRTRPTQTQPENRPQSKGSQRGRREPRNPTIQPNVHGRRNKGTAARSEKVVLSGQNEFLNMTERNQFKQDSDVDKKLWRGREMSPRPNKYEPIEVQCTTCRLYFDVNPSVVYRDPDSGDIVYTCNNCGVRK